MNPLLALNIGIDGLGAGDSEEGGYALVASVERDGARLFLAMGGLASEKARREEAQSVLEWGLSSFHTKVLFETGETSVQASVYGGASRTVDIVAAAAGDRYVPTDTPPHPTARLVYRRPLPGP